MLPFWEGECGGSFRTRRSAPSPALVLVRRGGLDEPGRSEWKGARAAGASRPPHQARPCGRCVGPGRAQSGHPDLSRPTLTVAQWQWRRAGTQLAANARWAAWAIEVNTRRRPTGSAGPTMAAHFDLPYSASALDGNSSQPRCDRAGKSRDPDFSQRTPSSRRGRLAEPHTTV